MYKPFLLPIFSLLLAYSSRGQTLEQTHALANRLFEQQQYEAAAKHFHRVAFFGNDEHRATVFPALASCYFESGQYEKSIFYFDLASNTSPNDSLANEYLFSKVLCHLLLENYDFALQDLYSTGKYESRYFSDRYHFYRAIIGLMKNEADTALVHFLKINTVGSGQQAIQEAFKKARLNHPSSGAAMVLSLVIPGLGQLYAGDYRNAAISFLLNTTLVGLSYSIAINYSFGDALLSTLPWLQRYYMGGFTKAKMIAQNKRTEKRDQLLQQVFAIIGKNMSQ